MIDRLTPPFMLLVFLMISFWPYVGDGPEWQPEEPSAELCRTHWWKMLLYVDNYDIESGMVRYEWFFDCSRRLFFRVFKNQHQPMFTSLIIMYFPSCSGIYVLTILIFLL